MRTRIVGLSGLLLLCACQGSAPDQKRIRPGAAPVLVRLNRAQYDNTLRDLFGIDERPAAQFPEDGTAYGFDNIGEVLSVSPILLELYHRTAERISHEVTRLPVQQVARVEAELLVSENVVGETNGIVTLFGNGPARGVLQIENSGLHHVVVRAAGQQAGPDPVRLAVRIGGVTAAVLDVPQAQVDGLIEYGFDTEIPRGLATIEIEFINDFYRPNEVPILDRNAVLDWIEFQGAESALDNPLRQRLYSCEPGASNDEGCAEQIISELASRAWRRPVTWGEVDGLMDIVRAAWADGDDFDAGVRWAVHAVLLSPYFLFRVEENQPTEGGVRPLNHFELASRLSYFLWNTMPDDELFVLAREGRLYAELSNQVTRMLADPRSSSLVDVFGSRWLALDALDVHWKDPNKFPGFSKEFVADSQTETRLLLADILYSGDPVSELLTSDTTTINQRLATHYGLESAAPGFAKVRLGTLPRRGLFGHASFLTLTSSPNRTSPVKRGKFVLDRLLCSSPPPPPPGVDALPAEAEEGADLRALMEAHRADPVCASCHTVMDPIGFGLENFDAMGAFRTTAGGFAIDPSDVLDGVRFSGPLDLGQLIAADPRFPRCVTEHAFVYGLGRALSQGDGERIDGLAARAFAHGMSLVSIIEAIVSDDAFLYREVEQ